MAETEVGAPAAHFTASLDRLGDVAHRGPILDLASGRGRHARAAARAGFSVVALDRNAEFLRELAAYSARDALPVSCVRADLEGDVGPPFGEECFAAILVFRYLHRPLMSWIERALLPGGLLVYETFTTEQRSLGWGPKRSEFLLDPGELPALFADLDVESYAEGMSDDDPSAQTGRLIARR